MTYEIHPAANEFPMFDDKRHAELVKDISTHGLREAIKLLDGKVLDGRNRLKACNELGIEPTITELKGIIDPFAYVWSLNGERRDIPDDTRYLIWINISEKSEAWQAAQQRIQDAANKKRSEAAKAQHEVSTPRHGETMVVGQSVLPPDKKVEPGKSAKAKASKTNRGAVARGDKLRKKRPDLAAKVVAGEMKPSEAHRQMKQAELKEKTKVEVSAKTVPIITCADALDWLKNQPEADALITDPPYSTDVENIAAFVKSWLPAALSKVKPTGRAYVCIGAYPEELKAYLDVWMPTQVLVWTYRNTLGPSPKQRYKQNWQAILYYEMDDAPPLNCPVMNEQFSVQDINAPDGRLANRFHAWQKPMELAERLVRHSTKEGDTILDPFCCTGTFLVAAGKLGRVARGCDIDASTLEIAESLGCGYE